MKTIKVSEATNIQLDWLVAKCEGLPLGPRGFVIYRDGEGDAAGYTPSTDWAQGGPIIEREKIDLYHRTNDGTWTAAKWNDTLGGGELTSKTSACPTPLIAAMRCYVVSELGDTVEVPEELT
jgi:hypothetical protein